MFASSNFQALFRISMFFFCRKAVLPCLAFWGVVKRKVSETKTTIEATCSRIVDATPHSGCIIFYS